MEIFYIVTAVLVPFAASLILSTLFGTLLHHEKKLGDLYVPLMFPLCASGMAAATLLSHRDLKYANTMVDALSSEAGGGTWIMRILTAIMIGMSISTIFSHYFNKRNNNKNLLRLYISFIAYFIGSVILPAFLGKIPAFIHTTYYVAPIVMAAILSANSPIEPLLQYAKFTLYALSFADLVVAIINPAVAVQPAYSGLIPGLDFRLWGVGAPNNIGPLALLSLLIEYIIPTRIYLIRILCITGSMLVLALAQSKTAWSASMLSIIIIFLYKFGINKNGRINIYFIITILLLLSSVVFGLFIIDINKFIMIIASTDEGAQLATLTGRTQIWEVALEAWKENPFFGYGPTIWNTEFRTKIGMNFAMHAHNQFMQTLSMSGTIGFIGFIFYLYNYSAGAFLAAKNTKGISVALIIFILLRCITEIPLNMASIFGSDFITMLLLTCIAARGLQAKGIKHEVNRQSAT